MSNPSLSRSILVTFPGGETATVFARFPMTIAEVKLEAFRSLHVDNATMDEMYAWEARYGNITWAAS